jgi:threonine/homoserine/homoserine lactone efflux protein
VSFEHFLALLAFAAVSSFTPGPNNTLLLSAGMNFGFRRALPMIFGVCLGFPLMIACVGLGLGEVFTRFPVIYTTLKYVGGAYMLWLAFKIATASRASDDRTDEVKPFSFFQMVMFQWVNPKGWVMSVTALSAYTVVAHYYLSVALVVGTFFVCGLGSSTTWVTFGASLRSVLNHPRYYRWINIALALTLVASLWPMLRH